MDKVKVILNPVAGQGYGAKAEPELRQLLQATGLTFDLALTERPWHAAELAERAALDGYGTVVAVGGDGTVNEVVNGLLAAEAAGTTAVLGVIPAGRGSDFASNAGVPSDMAGACRRLTGTETRRIDLGRLTVDDQPPRYFANILGVGFDAIVTVEARKVKVLRGLAVYLVSVLRTVLLYPHGPQVTLDYDGQQMDLEALMICAGNGGREGGGFFVTPEAKLDDGVLDLCIVRQVSQLEMLRVIPLFIKGTHTKHWAVTMAKAKRLTLSSDDAMVLHIDGEVLSTAAHRITCELLPQRLSLRC